MRMKGRCIYFLFTALFLTTAFLGILPIKAAEIPNTIYVSPDGDDLSSGISIDSPVQSMQRVTELIKEIKSSTGLPSGGVTVYLRQGEYYLENRMVLDSASSGTADSPITFCSYPGEKAEITGAKTIPAEGFHKVTDTDILNRIQDPDARLSLMEADLNTYGIDPGKISESGFGLPETIAPAEFFFDGVPMTLSRWPNYDMTQIAKGFQSTDNFFQYSDKRVENWRFNDDLWIRGYFVGSGWGDGTYNITGIDPQNQLIYTDGVPKYDGYNQLGKNYFYLNILEEIDMPGEYYIDRASNRLYFYPPYPIEGKSVKVSNSTQYLIYGNGAAYITFRDITFDGTKNTGLVFSGKSNHVLIDSCVIKDMGVKGVSFGNVEEYSSTDGCSDSGITNSEVKYCGSGGINLNGGDRPTLTAGNLYANNNHITDVNRIVKTYKPGVNLAGVGNKATSNLIHNGPHEGILMNGNDFLIDKNELYNLVTETDDAGFIYTGQKLTYRGNVISNNFFHGNKEAPLTLYGATAVYLDDGVSGVEVKNNVIANMYRGMLLSSGRDHRVYNNIIVNCAISMIASGWNVGKPKYSYTDAQGVFHQGLLDDWDYLNMPVDSDIWMQKYPEVAALKTDDHPDYPKNNVIKNNVIYKSPNASIDPYVIDYAKDPKDESIKSNTLFNQDISLADPADFDYSLGQFSPVYTTIPEFLPIDFHAIGLCYDTVAKDGNFDMKEPSNQQQNLDPSDGIYFSWKPTAYADRYCVTIAKDSEFRNIVTINESKENYCTLYHLNSNETYYWKVESIQDASSIPQKLQPDSSYFQFSTGSSAGLPSAVTNPIAYHGNYQGTDAVCLTWQAVLSASSYSIYRKKADEASYQLIAQNITDTNYIDTTASVDETDVYQIKGVNGMGEGEPSCEFSVKKISKLMLYHTNTTVQRGETSQIKPIAIFEDGSQADFTGFYLSYDSSEPCVAEVSATGLVQAKTYGTAVLSVTVKNSSDESIVSKLFLTVYAEIPFEDGYENSTDYHYVNNVTTDPVRSGKYSATTNGVNDISLYFERKDAGVAEVWFYDDGASGKQAGFFFQPYNFQFQFKVGILSDISEEYYSAVFDGNRISPVKRSVGWHQLIVEQRDINTYGSVYIDGVLAFQSTRPLYGYLEFSGRGGNGEMSFDDLKVLVVGRSGPDAVDLKVTGKPQLGGINQLTYNFYDYYGGMEQGSIISWYRSTQKEDGYSLITDQNDQNSQNGKLYQVSDADVGNYIKCAITPKLSDGRTGETVYSDAIGPIIQKEYALTDLVCKTDTQDVTQGGFAGGNLDISGKFESASQNNLNFTVFACVYQQGKLTQFQMLPQNGETTVNINVSFSDLAPDSKIKLLLWDSLAGMHPLAPSFSFDQSGITQ